jgi:hypothetical protein
VSPRVQKKVDAKEGECKNVSERKKESEKKKECE